MINWLKFALLEAKIGDSSWFVIWLINYFVRFTTSVIYYFTECFYIDIPVTQPNNETTGNVNQLSVHGLDDVFNKFNEKNIKDSLSSFLPHLPGMNHRLFCSVSFCYCR